MFTNNQPLYIIDGIPIEAPGIYSSHLDGYSYNPLTSLDPFDVTDMILLKDMSSTASYGLRASNGVAMIETLKPSEVRTAIDFSLRTGVSFSPGYIPQLNSDQYRTYANEILNSSGGLEETFKESYPGLYADELTPENYRYAHNTVWQKEIFDNSLMNDVYLRVRGGDEIARYGLSVGYLNHQGVIKETDYERINIRFVGTFNIFQWLRMSLSNNLSFNSSSLKESARVPQTSPILSSLFKAPLLMPYSFDQEGNQLTRLDDVESLGISNPAAVINSFSAENENYRFLSSMKIEGDISKYLKLNSIIGVNFNSINEKIFMPNHGMELYYDDEAFNAVKSMKNHLFAFYNDNYVSYIPDMGNLHQLATSAGLRINMNSYEEDWGIAKNSHENDEYKSLQDGITYLREMGGGNTKWNRMTAYANLKYAYKDKYLLYTAISSDASSRTGAKATDVPRIFDVPLGVFYSAGFAWRLSSEGFLGKIHFLDDLKWRITYGISGNDDIGNLSALDYYSLVQYRETSGMVPVPVTNEALKFETVEQWSTGMDFAMRGNKFKLSIDLFNSKTRDMMVYESIPYYLGLEYLPVNNGILMNKGIEVSLLNYLVYSEKFKWSIGITFASLHNELIKIADGQIITPFKGGEFISREGESLLNFYGYIFEGVISDTEEANGLGLKTDKGVAFGAGDAKFKDISGPDGSPDGIINDFDKTLIGSPIPKHYGGFTNYVSYKRWSLNLALQFVSGNKVYNYLRYQNEKMTDLSNQSTNVLNRWQYNGHETNVPRSAWADPTGNSGFSTRWIEDGSYLRLKNVTLAYTVPDKLLIFRNAEFYITGTNLLTFTKYLGYDPEFNYSFNTMEMGIDYGLTPFSRRIMMGIKIGL